MMWKLAFPFLAALLAVGFGQDPEDGVDVNPNDPDVQTALKVAIDGYNKASPDIYLYKVMKVIRVQRKMVEGYMYTLTVEIARTVCKKGSMAQSCPVFINPDRAKKTSDSTGKRSKLWNQWTFIDNKRSQKTIIK
uniref:Cystatin domain-containing protein n=1 Tax=Oryzias latipes TaxID=8090 RepID=A0A3P9MCY6_ORYLA